MEKQVVSYFLYYWPLATGLISLYLYFNKSTFPKNIWKTTVLIVLLLMLNVYPTVYWLFTAEGIHQLASVWIILMMIFQMRIIAFGIKKRNTH